MEESIIVLEGAKLRDGAVVTVISLGRERLQEMDRVTLSNQDGEIFAHGFVSTDQDEVVFEDLTDCDVEALAYDFKDTHDLFDAMVQADNSFTCKDTVTFVTLQVTDIERTEITMDYGEEFDSFSYLMDIFEDEPETSPRELTFNLVNNGIVNIGFGDIGTDDAFTGTSAEGPVYFDAEKFGLTKFEALT